MLLRTGKYLNVLRNHLNLGFLEALTVDVGPDRQPAGDEYEGAFFDKVAKCLGLFARLH